MEGFCDAVPHVFVRRILPVLIVSTLLTVAWPPAGADPDAVFSTYVGGEGIDDAHDVATDSSGNAYVAWREFWPDPDHGDGNDTVVVQKFSSSGALLWTKRMGGPQYDWVNAIAVGGGRVVVGGDTWGGWPTTGGTWRPTQPGEGDGWVAVLDAATGNLQWSTYLGGSDYDTVHDVDLDDAGNVYAVGVTYSCDYPTWNGLQAARPDCGFTGDAYATKLTASGSRPVYSTYISGSGYDVANSLVVSRSSGSAIIVGTTHSPDLPTTSNAYDRTHNGAADMFVMKLASDGGSRTFSTFLGGPEVDEALGVTRDASSNAYVVGLTYSAGMPVTPGAHMTSFSGGDCSYEVRPDVFVYEPCPDAYVAKLASTGSSLAYATFLGGRGFDSAFAVSLDASNAAYVTGETNSTDFPRIDGEGQGNRWSNGFAAALNPKGGTLAYATQLTGTTYGYGTGVAARPDGSAYYVGFADGPGFPTTPGAHRTQAEGPDFYDFEGYLVRLGAPAGPLLFEHRGGNEWWVEVELGGREADAVTKVEARDNGGAWTTLAKQPWGFWAGTMHVEPGNTVEYRATLASGTVRTSCAFTHPAGNCTQAAGFDATFSGVKGNEWWVEARVSGNQPLASVEASVNGGAWKPLTLRSWGAWAASFHVPAGSIVQLRATSTSGATDLSGCYQWTAATPVACGDSGGGGGEPSDFDATFRNVRGNEWWVETEVSVTGGTLAGVDARVNGGAWTALTKQSWGSWAKSIHAPAGSTVEFRARSTDGETDVSGPYRWPPA